MKTLLYTILILLFGISISAEAQRRITPVNPNLTTSKPKIDKKDGKEDMSRYVEARDEQGNVFLIDSITGKEYVDSAALKEKDIIKYPKFHELTIGLNIWDPVMRILGQKYGVAEAWAELSIHNRFKPVVEVGLGTSDYTPDDDNFTFKSNLTPYFRLGMNYNFLFKKTTDYQFFAGLRYGLSPFSYEVNNVSINGGYWNEPEVVNFPKQSTTVGYMELSAGLKVKIINNFYLGWALKFHSILHESKATYGKPWYIPGYGTRGTSITGAFSLMYTIPLKRENTVAVNLDENMSSAETSTTTP